MKTDPKDLISTQWVVIQRLRESGSMPGAWRQREEMATALSLVGEDICIEIATVI